MDSARWKLIEKLYHAAADLRPDERAAFLAEATKSDEELCASVTSLLVQDSATSGFGVPVPAGWASGQLEESLAYLQSGTVLGRYQVEKLVGIGGMSEVYRAYDSCLNRPVAIKILRNHFDKISTARFQREARSASALNHPNICTVYDMGERGEKPYLVMEYLDGCTVQESLRKRPFSIEQLVELAIHITDGLNKAHSCGIVHRDIKPSNIFITRGGQAKVLDFGIAKILASGAASDGRTASSPATLLTETGAAIGTVSYMSPEQARGESLDARSDLFSFGVLLYEMSTGILPFRGATAAITFDAILNREPAPVRSLRPDAPKKLAAIITSILVKDREKRLQTAVEARSALKDLREGMSGAEFSTPADRHDKNTRLKKRFALPTFLSTSSRTTDTCDAAESGEFSFSFKPRHAAYVLAFAVAIGTLTYLELRNAQPRIRSVAILPFSNESEDRAEGYFAEGITDTLISRLSKLHGLRVIKGGRSPNGNPTGLTTAQAFLVGSVRHSGDQVRVSMRFAERGNAGPISSRVYQRPVKEILTLENDISRDLAKTMNISLIDGQKAEFAELKLVSPDAYEAYLRGRQFWNRQTIPDLKKAAEEFRGSIEKGPSYAPAYAGLADSYSMLAWFGGVRPLDVLEAARAAAKKATQIDPSLAEGRISSGIIAGFFDWDWSRAEIEFQTAINLNPNLADAHHWYAHFLEAVGEIQKGLSELKYAHDLDPLSPVYDPDLVLAAYYGRNYESALAQLREMMILEPSYWRVHNLFGKVYREEHLFREAVSESEQAVVLSKANAQASATLAHAYAAAGRTADAERILARLASFSKDTYVLPETIAEVYAALGHTDQALQWLGTACDNHAPVFAWTAQRDPSFDKLRKDARFKRLLQRMNLGRRG